MAAATATRVSFKPLGDRVLVKPVEKKDEIRGGLIIPDTAQEKPHEGEIIAVGKGKLDDNGKLIPMDVKMGDRIIYGKYSGSEIKIDGQEYAIMSQDEILGIVEA